MTGRCAICRCPATATVFGFRVCDYHVTHGEDDPSCPSCNWPPPPSSHSPEREAEMILLGPLGPTDFDQVRR